MRLKKDTNYCSKKQFNWKTVNVNYKIYFALQLVIYFDFKLKKTIFL